MVVHAYLLLALLLVGSPEAGVTQPDSTFVPFDRGLVDVNGIYADVGFYRYPSFEPNDSAFASELGELLRGRLDEAGISVINPTIEQYDEATASAMIKALSLGQDIDPNRIVARKVNVPALRVTINLVSPDTENSLALYAHASFSRQVSLGSQTLKAVVWDTMPTIIALPADRLVRLMIARRDHGTVPVMSWQEEVHEAVCEAVLEQTDAFIAARKAAALHDGEAVAPVAEDAIRALGCPYVGSKNSSIFHNADCGMAQNIAPENLVGYNSREEAVAAGKRPCKTCNP